MLPVLKIFISYSRVNKAIVDELQQYIHRLGVVSGRSTELIKVWFDVNSILPGSIWKAELVDGLNEADLVCLFVSPDSIASQYVRFETQTAIDRHTPILPLLLQTINKDILNAEQTVFFEVVSKLERIDLRDIGSHLDAHATITKLNEFIRYMWLNELETLHARLTDSDEQNLIAELCRTRHQWAMYYFCRQVFNLMKETNDNVLAARVYVRALVSLGEDAQQYLQALIDWWRKEIPPQYIHLLEYELRNPVPATYWDAL